MKNTIIKLSIFIFFIFIFINLVSAETNVSSCETTLNVAGETYTLNKSINSTSGNCINIDAENITFNGNGYIINGTFTNAIYSDQYNTTIKNTIINSTTGTTGIYLLNSNSCTIINNSIILTTAGFQYGIQLETSSNVNISNNFINSSFINMYLKTSSTNNTISNNNLVGSMSILGGGIFIYTSSTGNIVSYNKINGSYPTYNSKGFYIRTNNNILIGNNITNTYYPYYYDTNAINNTILSNMSSVNYYSNEITITSGSQVFRKWYFDAQVNYSKNNLPFANINVLGYNITNTLIDNKTTDSLGKARLELIEYVNNGGTKTYYSNYTINVSIPKGHASSNPSSISINMSTNRNGNFLLDKLKVKIKCSGKLTSDGKCVIKTSFIGALKTKIKAYMRYN